MVAVQQQPYVVPLVLQNHSPAESMMQLLDSLEYFASTVDDAFSKLSGQLKQKKSELEKLNTRLQAVTTLSFQEQNFFEGNFLSLLFVLEQGWKNGSTSVWLCRQFFMLSKTS